MQTRTGRHKWIEEIMKLATYKDGSRDGQLVVVSRDLSMAHYATGIASKMQQLLDDWNFIAPQLQDLYETLNLGKARHAFPFDPQRCMAPLPRTGQWADGSAYLNHVDIVRRSRGAPVPDDLATVPCLVAAMSDAQVRDYVHARYGDFVLLRPPLNPGTLLLWAAPALAQPASWGPCCWPAAWTWPAAMGWRICLSSSSAPEAIEEP